MNVIIKYFKILLFGVLVFFCVKSMANYTSTVLINAPSWVSVQTNDRQAGDKLIGALRPLLSIETKELRIGVLNYIETLNDNNRLAGYSKLYVLNRLLFNVPDREDSDKASFFGGWGGIPFDDKYVNMMWPISRNTKGGFILVGYFGGYFGGEYAAIDEFDYLNNNYGRRVQQTVTTRSLLFSADKSVIINSIPFEPPAEAFYQWNDKYKHPDAVVAPIFIFPFEAKRGPSHGEVVVLVRLDKDGRPTNLSVLYATHPLFIPSAIAGLKKAQWKVEGKKDIYFYYKATYSIENILGEKEP